MKLSLLSSSVLFFSALTSASPVSGGQLDRRAQEWKLRALTSRGVNPVINDVLEVIDGAFVVGANEGAAGFVGSVDPEPKGELKTSDGEGLGFLFPQSTPAAGNLHDFKFGVVPLSSQTKYQDFLATSAGCGSHCGGPQLVYDEAGDDRSFTGNWLAYPREEGGYSIRWIDASQAVPEGHTIVYLMRDSV